MPQEYFTSYHCGKRYRQMSQSLRLVDRDRLAPKSSDKYEIDMSSLLPKKITLGNFGEGGNAFTHVTSWENPWLGSRSRDCRVRSGNVSRFCQFFRSCICRMHIVHCEYSVIKIAWTVYLISSNTTKEDRCRDCIYPKLLKLRSMVSWGSLAIERFPIEMDYSLPSKGSL